ncbi:MAG: hypothetical protein AB8B51_15125 [Sedimentitalea sp.]
MAWTPNPKIAKTLARIFGERHALAIYIFVHRFSFLIVFSPLCLTLTALFFLRFEVPKTRHVDMLRADVLGVVPGVANLHQYWVVDARLPDGTTTRVRTRGQSALVGVTDTTCLERRLFVETGAYFYALHPLAACAQTN